MFTGIIEEVGKIKDIRPAKGLDTIEISAREVLSDIKSGDSVCVDGVCLTVTGHKLDSFTVQAVKETLSGTTLGSLKKGREVNLERAMKPSDRLSGHIVTGHVDGTALISGITRPSGSVKITFTLHNGLINNIVNKGSIAVNGISLTVYETKSKGFSTVIIPHTYSNTSLRTLKTGDKVNIETDIIGKYIQNQCSDRSTKT